MPIATLQFNLPDDQEAHKLALDGWRWKAVVNDLDEWLKQRYSASRAIRIDDVHNALRKFMSDRGASLP